MPATRDLGGSTCSITVGEGEKMADWGFPPTDVVKVEGEWKKEDGDKIEDWGFAPSEVMENEEVSDQGQSETNENQGSHVNFAYFGVS